MVRILIITNNGLSLSERADREMPEKVSQTILTPGGKVWFTLGVDKEFSLISCGARLIGGGLHKLDCTDPSNKPETK